MIASMLTDETLILDNVPRLADVGLLQRILGNHGVDVMIGGKRRATRVPGRPCNSWPPFGRHHGALRTGVELRREFWVIAPWSMGEQVR